MRIPNFDRLKDNQLLELIKASTNSSTEDASKFLPFFKKHMAEYGINTPQRQIAFFAQIGVESGGLKKTSENMNYTPEGLMKTFSYFKKNPEEAKKYGRIEKVKGVVTQKANQEEIANRAYDDANRDKSSLLGNIEDGDGWKYRGSGYMQTTGKYQYDLLTKEMKAKKVLDANGNPVDFVKNPELLREPGWATRTSMSFFQSNGCNELADKLDYSKSMTEEPNKSILEQITKKINPAGKGMPERKELWQKGMEKARQLDIIKIDLKDELQHLKKSIHQLRENIHSKKSIA